MTAAETAAEVPIDAAEAQRFLRLVDPDAAWHTFQTFTDAEHKPNPDPLAKVMTCMGFTSPLLRLYRRRGAGMWVTVNETDGKGRTRHNMIRVRAVWQEDDGGYEGAFPLEPSIVNESSEGRHHRYWLVDGDWPADEKGRADFAGVMARMVASYGSDPGAKDLTRVLRVPGFVNRKRGAAFMVRTVGGNGLRYTRAEILAAFPPIAAPAKAHTNGHDSGTAEDHAELVRRVLTAESYHGSLRDLAWRYSGASMPPGAAVEVLRGFMLASQGPRDERWRDRFAKIPGLVGSAGAKNGGRAERFFNLAADVALTRHLEAPAEPPPAAPLVVRSAGDILATPPPARSWHVQNWVPGANVTGVFADGGEGKTTLGMQLAWCTNAGLDWLGMPVRQGPAIYFSAEEPDDELAIRLHDIARGMGSPAGIFAAGLDLVSRALDYALLCTFTRSGVIQPTPLWLELAQRIGDTKPRLVGIDALADVFGGDENDRSQVRQFVAMLRRPAITHDCAIVAMGHPSRAGIQTGTGFSGSTAWHNGVRARQYLTTPKTGDGEEPDRTLRTLKLHKSNSGTPGASIALRWHAGCFVLATAVPDADRLAEAKVHFVERLAAYTRQGRTLSHKQNANNYAPGALANKTFGKALLAAAMNALFDEGRLRIGRTPGPPSKSSEKLEAV